MKSSNEEHWGKPYQCQQYDKSLLLENYVTVLQTLCSIPWGINCIDSEGVVNLSMFFSKIMHTLADIYHCNHCEMDIANSTELVNHLRMHNEGSLYQCT